MTPEFLYLISFIGFFLLAGRFLMRKGRTQIEEYQNRIQERLQNAENGWGNQAALLERQKEHVPNISAILKEAELESKALTEVLQQSFAERLQHHREHTEKHIKKLESDSLNRIQSELIDRALEIVRREFSGSFPHLIQNLSIQPDLNK